MIYILAGTDFKKKSVYLKALVKEREANTFSGATITKDNLYQYASSASLFGVAPVVTIENMVYESEVSLLKADLEALSSSPTIFIFIEEKLLKADEAKYKKYTTIERFDEKAVKQSPKANTFAIADAYGRRDKVNAWMLYRDAVEKGVEPEAISGMLFWKLKQMTLSASKSIGTAELKNQSSELVSLHHRAHMGECDFTIGLEQFILSSLAK